MTTDQRSANQNKKIGYYFEPNQNGICVCPLCEPASWEKILKTFEYEIAQEKVFRAAHPRIPGGGFSPPSVRKRRLEEIREMHKLGISTGF